MKNKFSISNGVTSGICAFIACAGLFAIIYAFTYEPEDFADANLPTIYTAVGAILIAMALIAAVTLDVLTTIRDAIIENTELRKNSVTSGKKIKCPDCGAMIDEDADSCPNCGCPSKEFKK